MFGEERRGEMDKGGVHWTATSILGLRRRLIITGMHAGLSRTDTIPRIPPCVNDSYNYRHHHPMYVCLCPVSKSDSIQFHPRRRIFDDIRHFCEIWFLRGGLHGHDYQTA